MFVPEGMRGVLVAANGKGRGDGGFNWFFSSAEGKAGNLVGL